MIYKIVRFKTKPIDFRNKYESYLPSGKDWNKLRNLCKIYVQSRNFFPENDAFEIVASEMNTPRMLRSCGLINFPKSLDGNKFMETERVEPAGEMNGKRVQPQYIKISKKYILIDYKKSNEIELLKLAEYKRLDALKKEKPVKFYDIEINNSEILIINETEE